MAGTLRGLLATVLATLVAARSASAVDWRWAHRPTYAAPYSMAPVWYYVPAAAPCGSSTFSPASAPMPRANPLAQPSAAPPSRSVESPLQPSRAPTITESRSVGGVAPVPDVQVTPGRCKVGFWNITGEEVSLTIDGQTRTLAKNRAVTLELERTFVWQVSGRPPQTERVPDNQNLFEVIVRP